MSAAPQKDVVYIDIDDEITSIIDKVKNGHARLVAVVLPKRATMLQSTVNMKLLKRAAESSKKHLVLITSEASLLPLAGTVGIHVAKTLQSKPEIPAVAAITADDDSIEEAEDKFDSKESANEEVGNLAGMSEKPAKATPGKSAASDVEETLELPEAEAVPAAAEEVKPKKSKAKGDKKLRVPNFEKFRLRLFIAIGVIILLVIAWFVLTGVLSKATVTIYTNTSSVNANINLGLNTQTKSFDPTSQTLPAQLQQTQKTQTQQVPATGQKNEGAEANGTVTMTAQECAPNISVPADVPSGTGISTNGLTFVTQQDTSFAITGGKGNCVNYQATNSTPITAQSGGSNYNLPDHTTFSVSNRSDATATGGTSGGTDNMVKVVSQGDITAAQQKLSAPDTSSIKSSLTNTLKSAGSYPLTATFTSQTPTTTTSANAGDQATSVTVTQNTTYTMFGVTQDNLETVVDTALDGQINTSKQSILNNGLSKASYNVVNQNNTSAQVAMQVTGTAGPHLNIASLKPQIAGKKSADVSSILQSNPGVVNVKVKFSPFWVSTVPKNPSKVTITFKSANNGG